MTSTIERVTSRTCPICGRPLADTAPEGLCLVCLLEAGLDRPSAAEVIETAGPEAAERSHPRYFGDYEILREVGRGGMGVVYEARQFGTQRTVALKLLSAGGFASPDAVHRFHTEAQAAARLEHPHIVPVYEAGLHDGQHYLAMRFMPGGTLAQWVKIHPVEPRRAAETLLSLARAVAYAHQHGVLHRDLKPSNVLLDDKGEPHLADFGLARLGELEGGITLTSAILGTAPYMPPEQAVGGVGKATTAGDIYGLGAVLYELLTGRPPFTGTSVADILRKVQEKEPAAPLARKSEVSGQWSVVRGRFPDLQTICLKCLEKEPAKRYATAQDLADDLQRFLNDEPILARPATFGERVSRWCRRRPAIAGLSAALVLAVVAGFAGTLWQLQQTRRHAAENARLIARLQVRNGVDLMQEGDHFKSLLWFAEALVLNAEPPERTAVDRLRITSIVAMSPRLATLITHDGQPVADAAFHPAKDQLATVGRDRRLRVWAVPSGQLMFMTAPFDEPPSQVQFAPDGQRLLVVSSEFGQARLLSAMNGASLAGPIPHLAGGARNQPLAPRFDETGQFLLTQSAPHTLQVWSAAEASALAPLIQIGSPVVWMNFSADGAKILVRTQDGRTLVGEWRTGDLVDRPRTVQPSSPTLSRPSSEPSSPPLSQTLSEDTAALDKGNDKGPDQGRISAESLPRDLPGTTVDRARKRFLTFGRDRSVRLFDATTSAALLPPIEHPSLVEDARFSPDGARFATVTAAGRVRVWSADTGEPLTPPIDHNADTGPVGFSASGRFLFTLHPAHAVYLWDLSQSNQPPVLLRPGTIQTLESLKPQTYGHPIQFPAAPLPSGFKDSTERGAGGEGEHGAARSMKLETRFGLRRASLAESGRDGSVFVTRDPNSPIRVRALAGAAEVSLHPSSLKMVPVQAWFDQTGQFIILEGEQQRAQVWHAGTGLPVTPIFRSRYGTNEADYRNVRLPASSNAEIRSQRSEVRQGREERQSAQAAASAPGTAPDTLTSDLRPLTSGLRASSFELRLLAELLSGSRLDGTGGWKPLELGEIVARWNESNPPLPLPSATEL